MKTEANLPPEPITAQPKCRRWPLVVAWCVAGLFFLAAVGEGVRIEQMKNEAASLANARSVKLQQVRKELRASERHTLRWRVAEHAAADQARWSGDCIVAIEEAILHQSNVWPSLLPVLNSRVCQNPVLVHWTAGQWTMD